MMASAADRPSRSVYPGGVRRWCTAYARRWRVPLDELVYVIVGGEIIPFSSEVQARAVQVRDIAELLDAFIPAELQWNYWYRPSICNALAPMCRLGWFRTCLNEFQSELRAIHETHSQTASASTDTLSVLKLFKPATMFMRLERGCAVTHVVCERRPLRHQPLEFAPSEHAPWASGPPVCL